MVPPKQRTARAGKCQTRAALPCAHLRHAVLRVSIRRGQL